MAVFMITTPDGEREFPTYAEAKAALVAAYPETWGQSKILKEGEPENGYRTWSVARDA